MKRFMKGLLATTMVFAMMTSLVGCGGSEPAAEESTTDTLVMATNATFPPYEFYEGEEIVGIDAELGAAIAEKLGMEFKIEDMEFDA
ncbi:MAG: transporter substrate-binding domain-containing protein, partial [Anaerotignum sp.]|nr:transporter substrate-binding domain-containing protein [Anaerotignum sp.]